MVRVAPSQDVPATRRDRDGRRPAREDVSTGRGELPTHPVHGSHGRSGLRRTRPPPRNRKALRRRASPSRGRLRRGRSLLQLSLSLRTSHDRGNLPRRGGQSVPVDGAGEPGGEGESARRSAEQLRGRHHGGSVRLFVFCRRWTEAPKCRSHEAAWHAWGELEKRDGNYQLAKDCWMKGIRHAKGTPSPYLFLSLARLATDLGLYDQARHWFRCVPSRRGDSATGSLRTGTGTARGSKSYVLWTAWALLEQKQGQTQLMRRLFEQSLKVRARSQCHGTRSVEASWVRRGGTCTSPGDASSRRRDAWKKRGSSSFGQPTPRRAPRTDQLTRCRGHAKNPADAALLQALARLEAQCGNFEEARMRFQQVSIGESEWREDRCCVAQSVDVDPRHLHSWQAWGVFESRLGNHERARDLFQRGIWAAPSSRNAAVIFEVRSVRGCPLSEGGWAAGVGSDGGAPRRPGRGADAVQVRRQGGSAQRGGVDCLDPARGERRGPVPGQRTAKLLGAGTPRDRAAEGLQHDDGERRRLRRVLREGALLHVAIAATISGLCDSSRTG